VTHRKDWTPAQRKRYGNSNDVRDAAGAIATLDNGEVIHCTGYLRTALRVIADYCDSWGLKVVTVSTPRTIAADLKGRNTYYNGLGSRRRVNSVEQTLLGQIGRIALCAPPPLGYSRRRPA